MNTQTTRTENAYDPDACVPWAYRKGLSIRKLRDNRIVGRVQLSAAYILFGVVLGVNSVAWVHSSLYGGIIAGLFGYALLRKGATTLVWLYRSERPARDTQYTTAVEIEDSRPGPNCTITRGTADVRTYNSRHRGPSAGYTWTRPCVFIDLDEAAVSGLSDPLQAGHALEHAIIKEHRRQQEPLTLGGQATHGSALNDSGTNILFDGWDEDVLDILYEDFERVLQDAREVLSGCPCPGDDGCHNCCHTHSCGQDNKTINATEAVELADNLLEDQ